MSPLKILLRAWPVVAFVDFCFATVLTWIYGRTFAGLWQGVAATAFGAGMREAGALGVLAGIAMHITVAFGWTTVFVALATQVAWVRRAIATPAGILLGAAIYGPFIWTMMSRVLIPFWTGTTGPITGRWWIQAAGHVCFVALPMLWMVSRSQRAGTAASA